MSGRTVSTEDLREVLARVSADVVGRERELELMLAAVATGRDLLIEGPPGTSKTTLLRAITRSWSVPLLFVEGNAELTPGRLLGHHDPARVLHEGFSEETFVPGPLVEAMQSGGFLYFEELNRAPEDALNVLLGAVADREVSIPRMGIVRARHTFRVIGSMNPFDNVGTTRLSVSIRDRFCRMTISYQDAAAERAIVALRGAADSDDAASDRMLSDAVALTRMTREHPFVRQGSSVRGAIDLYLLVRQIVVLRDGGEPDGSGVVRGVADYAATVFDAMLLALSGRILLDEAAGVDAETVLREIWEQHFILGPATAAPG